MRQEEPPKNIYTDSPRRSGQTTRMIDELIQEFFKNPGKRIALVDHFYTSQDNVAKSLSKTLIERIKNRLDFEHPNAQYQITAPRPSYPYYVIKNTEKVKK